MQLAPPHDVGGVTERADHRDTGTLLRVGEWVREHRDRHAEQRRADHLSEPARVPRVVGMGDERNARGEQLGPRGLDDDVRGSVHPMEAQRVVRSGRLAVFEFGLRDRSAVVHIPQRGRLGRIRLVARKHP